MSNKLKVLIYMVIAIAIIVVLLQIGDWALSNLFKEMTDFCSEMMIG